MALVDGRDLKVKESIPSVLKQYETVAGAAFLNGSLYVFVKEAFRSKKRLVLNKYSTEYKVWKGLENFNYRRQFCMCGIDGNIYIVGGNGEAPLLASCVRYDTKAHNYKEVSPMNTARTNAASANYQGKIVVSGGFDRFGRNVFGTPIVLETNTVEVYDHVADAWSRAASMVESRFKHSLVAVGSKLFVVGKWLETCEVFDKVANEFALIRPPLEESDPGFLYIQSAAVSLGNKIFVFKIGSEVQIYDTEKEEWCEKSFGFSKSMISGKCFKMPQMWP